MVKKSLFIVLTLFSLTSINWSGEESSSWAQYLIDKDVVQPYVGIEHTIKHIQRTTDGGYIATGLGRVSNIIIEDTILFVKMDSARQIIWSKHLKNTYVHPYFVYFKGGYFIDENSSGFQIVADAHVLDISSHALFSAIVLIDTDFTGNVISSTFVKHLNSAGADVKGVIKSSSGYIVYGRRNLAQTSIFTGFVIQITNSGYSSYFRDIGLGSSFSSSGTFVGAAKETSDFGCIIAGTTETNSTDKKMYLAKLDRFGNVDWVRTYSNQNSFSIIPVGIFQIDGYKDYVVIGFTYLQQIAFLRINQSGTIISQQLHSTPIGTIYYDDDFNTPIATELPNNNYAVSYQLFDIFGRYGSTTALLVIDESGRVAFSKTYGAFFGNIFPTIMHMPTFATFDDNGILIASSVTTFTGVVGLFKTDDSGNIEFARWSGFMTADIPMQTLNGTITEISNTLYTGGSFPGQPYFFSLTAANTASIIRYTLTE
jgi:hypothetical protein